MKFLVNRKLATRIGILTTVITLAGLLLLLRWQVKFGSCLLIRTMRSWWKKFRNTRRISLR